MTRPTISASLREALNDQDSDVAVLAFVTITHPLLEVALRFVSDSVDYVRGGENWIGLPFDLTILSDDETPPTATLKIPNVDRAIGEAILAIGSEAPRVTIELLSSADFDLTSVPRTEIGTAHVEYQARDLYLVDVSCNVLEVSGTLKSWDYSQEIWPRFAATKDRLPGLFW